MRLLDTKSKSLKEFRGDELPQYAIFSHCWQATELSLQDMDRPNARELPEYTKVSRCCDQAFVDGYKYIWMDTCCIDKNSSSELSEAINSMYRWYKRATVCYVFLEDVKTGDMREFMRCRWFGRGWTLQELIAPSSVIFFSQDWEEIGSKASLAGIITSITGIPRGVLLGNQEEHVSVAQRMAWAARRQTTRVEDRAYSLMGLFGISMPAIYGEGRHAFTRLQHEIMRTSNDQSIFAWKSLKRHGSQDSSGLLASSPDDFLDCTDITSVEPSRYANLVKRFTKKPLKVDYSTTNHGIHITLPMKMIRENCWSAILGCQSVNGQPNGQPHFGSRSLKLIGIHLSPTSDEYGPPQYARIDLGVLDIVDEDEAKTAGFKLRNIYVQQRDPSMFRTITTQVPGRNVLQVRTVRLSERGFSIHDIYDNWENTGGSLSLVLREQSGHGNLLFRNSETGQSFSVCIGIYNGLPWSHLLPGVVNKSAQDIHKSYDTRANTEHSHIPCQNLDWIHHPIHCNEEDHSPPSSVRITIRKQGVFALEARYLVTIALLDDGLAPRPDVRATSPRSPIPIPPQPENRGLDLRPGLGRSFSIRQVKVDPALDRFAGVDRVDFNSSVGVTGAVGALRDSLKPKPMAEVDLDAAVYNGIVSGLC